MFRFRGGFKKHLHFALLCFGNFGNDGEIEMTVPQHVCVDQYMLLSVFYLFLLFVMLFPESHLRSPPTIINTFYFYFLRWISFSSVPLGERVIGHTCASQASLISLRLPRGPLSPQIRLLLPSAQ